MNNEATQSVPASVNNIFTHTPRQAIVWDSHPGQRYFGEDSHTATCGLPNNNGIADASALVGVERIGHMSGAARLVVESLRIDGASFSVAAQLRPAQLRELARRLIDAAADIEANPASALLAAESAREGAAA